MESNLKTRGPDRREHNAENQKKQEAEGSTTSPGRGAEKWILIVAHRARGRWRSHGKRRPGVRGAGTGLQHPERPCWARARLRSPHTWRESGRHPATSLLLFLGGGGSNPPRGTYCLGSRCHDWIADSSRAVPAAQSASDAAANRGRERAHTTWPPPHLHSTAPAEVGCRGSHAPFEGFVPAAWRPSPCS